MNYPETTFNFKKIELGKENPIYIGPSFKRVPHSGLIESGDYNINIQVNDPNELDKIVVNMDSFHENIKHTKETISTLNHSLEENLSKLDSHRINLKESIYDLKNQISASYKGPRRLKSYCLTGMILATMFCLVCVLDGFGTFLSMEIDDVTMEIKNVTSEIKHFQDQILDKSENTTNIPSSLFPSSYSSTSTISTTMVDLTTLSPVTSPFPSVSTTYRYTTLGTTTSYTPSPQCNCRLIMFLAHYALRFIYLSEL